MDEFARRLEHRAYAPIRWLSHWQRGFLLATGILASTILLKYIAVQYLELLYLLEILLLFFQFVGDDLRSRWFRPFVWILALYLFFMAATLALSVSALRFQFYIPANVNWIFHPVYITLERIVELFASTFIMVSLADLFRQEPNKLRFTMRIYFWTGLVSALYSYVSYVVNIRGGNMYGAYLVTNRLRGFYNEGGPYGLYLLTVIFVGIGLHQLRWEPVLRMRVGLVLLLPAFYLSYSKAAFSAAVLMLLINGLFARGLGKRMLLLGAMAAIAAFGAAQLNLGMVLSLAELSGGGDYERVSLLRGGDTNYVYGRIAARFIVPRMIAAHPYTGIGWGNYGLLRNDPAYRGASFYAEIPDQPGLGLMGYAAELGLPLLGFLIVLLVLPWVMLRLRGVPVWVSNLALMSPLVHVCGAQLNVTYPWIVTAFALGMGYSTVERASPIQKLQLARTDRGLKYRDKGGVAGTLTEGTNG